MNDRQSVNASQPTGRPRGPDPAKRALLLQIARRRFVEDGYKKTSVSAIVRDAGLAQGTFYLHFKSKDHLLGQLRWEVLAAYNAAFEAGSAGDGPADARLLAGLRAIQHSVNEHKALVRVFRQAASGAEVDRQVLSGRKALAVPLAAVIEQGAAQGCFTVGPPVLAAHFVISLLANLVADALFQQDPHGQQVLDEALRFLLRGLGVPEPRVALLLSSEAS